MKPIRGLQRNKKIRKRGFYHVIVHNKRYTKVDERYAIRFLSRFLEDQVRRMCDDIPGGAWENLGDTHMYVWE